MDVLDDSRTVDVSTGLPPTEVSWLLIIAEALAGITVTAIATV